MPERFTASLSTVTTILSVGKICKSGLSFKTQCRMMFFNSYGLSPNICFRSSGLSL